MRVLKEHLNEFNYMASVAKLDFRCEVTRDGFDLTWSGYNDAMPNYVDEVLTRILAMKDSDLKNTFDVVKEKLLLDWRNHYVQ